MQQTVAKAGEAVEPFVGVPVVARTFGVSEHTVRRLVATGILPHYRVGGQLRFRISELAKASRKDPQC